MKDDHIWDDYYKNYGEAICFKNFKEYFNYLDSINRNSCVILQNAFYLNDKPQNSLEKVAEKRNKNLVFNDIEHQIVLFRYNNGKTVTYMSNLFFYAYKQIYSNYEIDFIKREIKENRDGKIYINDVSINDNLINFLNNNSEKLKNKKLFINSVKHASLKADLSKLKVNHVLISTNNSLIFGKYTLADLFSLGKAYITLPVYMQDMNYFEYLDQNAVIELRKDKLYDEEKYYANIKEIFKTLKGHIRHHYNLTINCESREVLNASGILKNIPSNINLRINNLNDEYKANEYKENDEKIDEFVEYIKNSSLSNFEKYLEVYSFVSNYKSYNKTKPFYRNNYLRSRGLKHVLDNNYMVCVGYSNLLFAMLEKVGIPCAEVHTDTIKINEKNEIKEGGHRRALVKIDDDKYNIHGLYLCDPTFDNSLGKDSYVFSLFTFDELKGGKTMERVQPIDLLFDFKSREEFYQKLNYFVRTYCFDKSMNEACMCIYFTIMEVLNKLDKSKYNYFYDKYMVFFDKTINPRKAFDKLREMLSEYVDYLLPLINKSVPKSVFASAIVNNSNVFGREIDNDKVNNTKLNNTGMDLVNFPFELDNNTNLLNKAEYEVSFYKNNTFVKKIVIRDQLDVLMAKLEASVNEYEIEVNRVFNSNKKNKKI